MGFPGGPQAGVARKIYKDCIHCPRLTDCDEIAMVRGKIPANVNGLRDLHIAIPLVRIKQGSAR